MCITCEESQRGVGERSFREASREGSLASAHLVGEEEEVAAVALVLVHALHPLLLDPMALRVPRRLVRHLRLHVLNALQLLERLQRREPNSSG